MMVSNMHTTTKHFLPRFRLPKALKRFRRNDHGATAVEFALVGGPFFLLLIAIVEVSIFFFAGQVFESSVDSVGRMVRTGQINSNTTESEFKQLICDATSSLFDCNEIHIDLTVVATFDELTDPPEITDLNTDLGGFQYTAPGPAQIVKLTAMYEWPVVTNYVASGLSKLDSGNALLTTIAIFKTEPWPVIAPPGS